MKRKKKVLSPGSIDGRPLIKVDWQDFDKLCGLQCTLEEFAAYFNCDTQTIERAVLREKKLTFGQYYEQKKGRGKVSLRRKQFEIAMSGDRTMLVWLGKQMLGQSDKQEQTLSIKTLPQLAREVTQDNPDVKAIEDKT